MGVSLLALARYTLNGPYQAAAVVGALAVLAVFLPPMGGNNLLAVLLGSMCMVLSCILVSLIILTQGSVAGFKAIAVSMLGITVVAWILVNAPSLGLWVALVQWLPIIVLSQTLRSSNSLALTVLAGVGLGAIAVAAQHLLLGPVENELLNRALLGLGEGDTTTTEVPEATLELLRLLVMAMVAMVYLFVMVMVFTARWLQARLADSDGFGKEFRALALGRSAATLTLALVALAVWLPADWLLSIVFLLAIAFMFQGLAVVHSRFGGKRQGRLILTIFYTLLLLSQPVIALTAVTGVIDNWLGFRKHLQQPDDENER